MIDVEYTPDNIWALGANECIVFGSNQEGRHGKGLALECVWKWGAERGVGEGPTGQCYALPTKSDPWTRRSLEDIGASVDKFLAYAEANPGKIFLCTAVGTGLAGYTTAQISPLFFKRPVSVNVRLPQRFWETAKALQLSPISAVVFESTRLIRRS